MADLRPQIPVKIVDPTTNSQEAGVDSGGNLQVILASNTGVDIGDVDVTSVIPGTGATNLGKAIDTATGATDTGVLILATRDDALGALTPAAGDAVDLRVDANGALWTHDDVLDIAISGSELQVDVVAALPVGANTIGDVTISAPATGALDGWKLEDAPFASGDAGMMMLAIRQDTASAVAADLDYIPLQVDASGKLYVTDANAGAGSPSTPVIDEAGDISLTAGTESTTEFRTVDVGADTFRLAGVDISGAAAFRAEISSVDNDVVTIFVTLFSFNGSIQWRPPNKDYTVTTWAGTAGFDGFQVLVTNLDTSETTDFYVSMYYED